MFVETLHGSYAYLLIFQILLVTALFLSFLWLVAQRIRRSAGSLIALSTENAALTPPKTAGEMSELNELKGRLSALQAENDKHRAASDENKSLREKIRYLESKLLEYEILQEEIGTLSALKLENEKLKEEIVHLKPSVLKSRLSAPRTVVEAAPPVPEVSSAPVETTEPSAELSPEPQETLAPFSESQSMPDEGVEELLVSPPQNEPSPEETPAAPPQKILDYH